jgi:hypothetical protein
MPPELLGPTGLTVAALAGIAALGRVIQVLWREHLRADKDDRDQRDVAQRIAEKAVSGLGEMADAWEQRNHDEAARRRKSDD